ncbi:MAG: aminoglycoside phosphotransferase family protein [Spirochaetales bacterium]|nr:aminoglycoside phosphotransferase family protein [Spirochaetales bacterium]
MTCLICPNGCGLSFTEKEGIFLMRGNRCIRGVRFMERQMKKEGMDGVFSSEEPFLHYNDDEISALLKLWDRQPEALDEKRFIQGSPERSLYRTVVLSRGEKLILEQIEPDRAENHEKTARRLERLSERGLPVNPFLRGTDGNAIQRGREEQTWQLSRLVEGTALNRETYWRDGWRGEALGQFLCALYAAESPDPQEPAFDLPAFINGLIEKIALNRGDLLVPLLPVLHRLEENLFPRYSQIPSVFGHGDPHPLNVIWGKDRLLAMIDWEFCGTKPLLYDASLIMGCVGSESPEAFDGPFNRAFYTQIKGILTEPSGELLPDFILAQRFAWLNEWLRHEDEAMVQQEISYMNMLL